MLGARVMRCDFEIVDGWRGDVLWLAAVDEFRFLVDHHNGERQRDLFMQ